MIALSNLSVVIVSRLVIDRLGIEASGIFSNAWRIASVYLGAVTTTAISYYLPTLTRATSDEQLSRDVNATVRFYLYLLPLIMAAIMTAAEPIVWLILSSKFLPVAPLLLLFVPAELMRILGETAGMPLLARRHLKPFTLLFAFQTVIFVGGAALMLPYLGLAGAAAAYGAATTLAAVVTFFTGRFYFPLRLEGRTGLCLITGSGLARRRDGRRIHFSVRHDAAVGLRSGGSRMAGVDATGRRRQRDTIEAQAAAVARSIILHQVGVFGSRPQGLRQAIERKPRSRRKARKGQTRKHARVEQLRGFGYDATAKLPPQPAIVGAVHPQRGPGVPGAGAGLQVPQLW